MITRIIKSIYFSIIKEYKLIQHEKEQKRLRKIWTKKWNEDLAWLQEQSDKEEKVRADVEKVIFERMNESITIGKYDKDTFDAKPYTQLVIIH